MKNLETIYSVCHSDPCEPCIKLYGFDPMAGTGTTGAVAKKLKRQYIMIDAQEFMCRKMRERLKLK